MTSNSANTWNVEPFADSWRVVWYTSAQSRIVLGAHLTEDQAWESLLYGHNGREGLIDRYPSGPPANIRSRQRGGPYRWRTAADAAWETLPREIETLAQARAHLRSLTGCKRLANGTEVEPL